MVDCEKAQNRSLLFLRPTGGETPSDKVGTCLVWNVEPGPRPTLTLSDLAPSSYQAAFCVASDTDKNKSNQRLLQQDARSVVLATDFFVTESAPAPSFWLPVIVTTASLHTFRYEPTEVSLERGTYDKLELDHQRFEQIPWVRFHKSFTTDSGLRTVFVVNAAELPKFLDAISHAYGH